MLMEIMTIYTVWDISCWHARVWNVHNTTQEGGAERTGGLFLLANLLASGVTVSADVWGSYGTSGGVLEQEWITGTMIRC